MNIFSVKGSLILAGGIIAISASLAGLEALGVLSGNVSERGVGVVMGLMVMAYGNAMPKLLVPMSGQQNEAKRQALQRFCGWAMVIGGIGYVLAFMFLPIDYAAYGAVACGGTAVLLVLARCLMVRRIV